MSVEITKADIEHAGFAADPFAGAGMAIGLGLLAVAQAIESLAKSLKDERRAPD